MCNPDSLRTLIESVDWDLDDESNKMNSWEFIHGSLGTNSLYVQILFTMRKWPLIKHYTSNKLFIYIAFVYDLVSTYIEAHEIVENSISEVKRNFPKKNLIQKKIKKNFIILIK
jgi:hypothetical protein